MVMREMALALLAAGLAGGVAMPAAAQAQEQAQEQAQDQAQADFFEQLDAFYETAGAPALINDAAGRLAIYRETLTRLDAAPAPVRADPRFGRTRLFYEIAIATTMPDAGEIEPGLVEVARLIPAARDFHRANANDHAMTDGLIRLLRVEGQFAQRRGDRTVALSRFREVLSLTRSLIPANGDVNAYGARALAIDLDNLSNMEAQAGNRAEADAASAEAVRLFRILAERDRASRPAQGSLLVALTRRALNFNDQAALNDAERQLELMQSQGMMTPNYAPVRDVLAELRRRNPR